MLDIEQAINWVTESGWGNPGVQIAIIFVIALLINRLIARGTTAAFQRANSNEDSPERRRRLDTLRRVLVVVVRIVTWTIAIAMALSALGISIAPLLTTAGVAGIAIGFAAQSLVKDYFTGIVLLLEGQLRVDDVVKIGGQTGAVEEITLRYVRLRNLEGQVIFVPCGNITDVTNYTMNFAYALIDVGVAYREDPDEALAQMREVAGGMAADPDWSEKILDEPEVMGVNALADSSVILRIRMKVAPGEQWAVQREFHRRIKRRFDDLSIEIPFPHLTVYPGQPKQGSAPPLNLSVTARDKATEAADRLAETQD